MNRRISERGATLILDFEGLISGPGGGFVYNDPTNHATVGYGHLIHLGPFTAQDVAEWAWMDTEAKARQYFRDEDIGEYEGYVNDFGVPLRQNEFDALVSFVFNVGPGGLRNSTLGQKLRAGDRLGAADELLKWNKGGGKVLAGLTRRREAERALFLDPTEAPISPPTGKAPLMFVCGIPNQKNGVGAWLVTGGTRVAIWTGEELARLRDRGIPNLDMECPSMAALPIADGPVDVQVVDY